MPEDLVKKRARWRRWYQNCPERAKKYYRNKSRSRKKDIKKWFKQHKNNLACERCKEDHPNCLEFHHKDPLKKDFNLSAMASSGYSIERIQEELDKCIVLCGNCHRKEHAQDWT